MTVADCTVVTLHPAPDELEAFVAGVLGHARAASIERHVAACSTCAARLRAEARIEVALFQAAEDLEDVRPAEGRGRPAKWISSLTSAVATIAAAFVLAVLQPATDASPPTRAASPVEGQSDGAAVVEHDSIPWSVDPSTSPPRPLLAAAGPMCGPDGSTLVGSSPAAPETPI